MKAIFKSAKSLASKLPFYRGLLFFALYSLFAAASLFPMTLDETLNALRQISGNVEDAPEFRWDPFFRDGIFMMGGNSAAFSAAAEGERGFLVFDNREVYTVPLPFHRNNELIFPQAFVNAMRDAFSRYVDQGSSRYRIVAIVIDPGHGGRDPGASRTHVIGGRTVRAVEKDIVLDVSLRLRDMLRRTYPDKRIILTRETDVFLTLEERVTIANSIPLRNNETVIFISVHANYSFNRNARGFEVFYLSPDVRRNLLDPSRFTYSPEVVSILDSMLQEEIATESIILGQSLLRNLGQTLGPSVPNRGLKNANWFVVRNSHMPAVLVELGFVSNEQDALLMTSQEGLRKFTNALYNGIVDFVNFFHNPWTGIIAP